MEEEDGKAKQKREGGRRKISLAFYEALLEAYRANPGNYTQAAKRVKCNRATATRAWKTGWPEFDWAPPIRDVIEAEQEIARARLAEEEERRAADTELLHPPDVKSASEARREAHIKAQQDKELARLHAISARAEIGKMIENLRKLTVSGEQVMAQRHKGAVALSERVGAEMLKLAKASAKKFDPVAARAYLRSHLADLNTISMAAKRATELERQHLGDPDKVIQVNGPAVDFGDLDESELMAEIKKAEEMMKRYDEDGKERTPDPDAVH